MAWVCAQCPSHGDHVIVMIGRKIYSNIVYTNNIFGCHVDSNVTDVNVSDVLKSPFGNWYQSYSLSWYFFFRIYLICICIFEIEMKHGILSVKINMPKLVLEAFLVLEMSVTA